MIRSRISKGVLGAAAAVAIAPTAVSWAQPGGPLIETACSYEQVVSALRVEAPIAADFLDDNPTAQNRLRAFLALPVDGRRDRLQQKLDENPEWRTTIDERRNTPAGADVIQRMQRIADTCGTY